MTESSTIAGSNLTPNGTKPGSTDENPGAPDMSRGHATPVPGVQPQADFGATDPAASAAAPGNVENGRSGDPFKPTDPFAEPTRTVELSSSGADQAAKQDKDSDQARKDEANNEPKEGADARSEGKSFGDVRDDAKAAREQRAGRMVGDQYIRDPDHGGMDPKNNPPRSNETDTIVPQAGDGGAQLGRSAGLAGGSGGSRNAANEAPVDGHGVGYSAPEPTVGRIVLYRLSQADADRINTRRVYGAKGADGSALEEGESVQAGVEYPAVITSVGANGVVNLHVFADGNHGVWAKGVSQGSDGGGWSWPKVNR